MTVLATLALVLAGCIMLALSLPKHYRDAFGKSLPRKRQLVLRGAGWLFLAAALLLAIGLEGSLVGIVLWLGGATVTALAIAMVLPRARA